MDIHEFTLTPQRRRAVHDLLADPGAPARHSRGQAVAAARRDRPGGRHPHRPRGVGVARLRPHPARPTPTRRPPNSASYDAFHINSIQPLRGGHVLVSARDTSAIYEIDRATGGRIVWTLGGKASGFRLGRGAQLLLPARRPDAARQRRVSLFDDEAGPPQKAPASRGLILQARPTRRHRHRGAAAFHRAERHLGPERGQRADARRAATCSSASARSRSSPSSRPSGRLVFDAALPQDDGSYRVYRFPWNGDARRRCRTPRTRDRPVERVAVYASWNGATNVARWQVLAAAGAAPRAAPRRPGTASRRGSTFRPASEFAVRALDARGRVLGDIGHVHATVRAL